MAACFGEELSKSSELGVIFLLNARHYSVSSVFCKLVSDIMDQYLVNHVLHCVLGFSIVVAF